MNFFTQQFQAPSREGTKKKNLPSKALWDVKASTATAVQPSFPSVKAFVRSAVLCVSGLVGPCKACRDICESCGKPRYRCTSADERLEASDDANKADEERVDTDDDEARLKSRREQTRAASKAEDSSPMLVSGDKNRMGRAPPERKSKDINSIKRVRAKRNTTKIEDGENEPDEDREVIEEQQLDEYRESPEPRYTPVESDPVQPQPSAFPTKTAKKTKPSKKIISQTVVYKEKEKVPKS
ncbi:hypothetical protein OS493_033172 [Desmophyllum pertusum]|uniref:Uncharacterized protein n=1 Tax=Desmophyllum pertusum TaxID=174260 RepID=A0A9X0CIF3_9CNID|nr:hypothetical protein OS493_033172 [Desmophyllum pertusum]